MSISADPLESKRISKEVNSRPLIALLIACGVFIFVLPVIDFVGKSWFGIITFTAIVVLAASIASPTSKRIIILAIAVILFEWIINFSDFIFLHYTSELITNIFIVWVVFSFVLQIMQREEVSLFTMIEALVGYLLLGIMFTSLVTFVDSNSENAFSTQLNNVFDRGYYTLITLTTTGYGDITPVSDIAKSLSLLISIFGQFYVAVIVAIIVGKYSNRLSSN